MIRNPAKLVRLLNCIDLMWKRSVALEIQELLGEGGQGRVYKALRRDRWAKLEQTVAVKILHSQTTVELWRLEFESLSKVRSVHFVKALGFERLKGKPALILEYVDGFSLAEILRSMILELDAIAELRAQIELALRELHNQGLVHGDLSPQNIMVDTTGSIRILDFGLANCLKSELRVTPRFASPERLRGDLATPADDLYALGRILELLLGEAPTHTQLSQYLHSDSAQRHFADVAPTASGQALLKRAVQRLQQTKQLSRTENTQVLPVEDKKSESLSFKGAWMGLILFLSLTTSTAAPIRSIIAAAPVIEVRTARWHYIYLDGVPVGYAPVQISLVPDKAHVLTWVSARGRGTIPLEAKAGQSLRLTDSDFSH